MTPDEVFRAAVRRAEPRGAAPTGAVAAADACEISEQSRQLFTGGLQRVALPDVPLLPVPTTPRSPWYQRRCAECRHTFRVDDPAATCPRCGRVYHWNPIQGLDCLGVVFDNEEGRCICREERVPEPPPMPDGLVGAEQMSAFVGGLAGEWSAYGRQKPVVVTPEWTCGAARPVASRRELSPNKIPRTATHPSTSRERTWPPDGSSRPPLPARTFLLEDA